MLKNTDTQLITAIATKYRVRFDVYSDTQEQLERCIAEAHAAHPLRLLALLIAEPHELGHDVAGISRFWDSITREYRDYFYPRFSV